MPPINRHLAVSSLAVLAFILVACTPPAPVEWHMVNVNIKDQGDAHLIIDGSTHALIDTGRPEAAVEVLIPYLTKLGIDRLDHLIISHPHTDHYGGLEALLDVGVKIDNIYFNLPPQDVEDWNYKRKNFLQVINRAQEMGAQIHDLSEGYSLQLPSSKITVLYAHKTRTLNNKDLGVNDYSLILAWDTKHLRTLFTGDLEALVGGELAKRSTFRADILKIPHHGVSPVAPTLFLDAVQPKLLMFPSTRVLWWHQRGDLYRTWTMKTGINYCHNGFNGHVVLKLSKKIEIQSQLATESCKNGVLDLAL